MQEGDLEMTLAPILLLALMALSSMPAPTPSITPLYQPPVSTMGSEPRSGLSTEGFWSWQDYPYWVPRVEPEVYTPVEGFLAANFTGPVSFNFTTPTGEYSRIVLRLELSLVSLVEDRPAVQYDRPIWVWVNGVPAFIGTTPQRFNSTAFADVTHLYSLLVGGHNATITVALPNWVIPRLGLTGAFNVTVKLLYYPGSKPSGLPDMIVPLMANSSNSPWPGLAAARITTKKPVAWELSSLPSNTARAYLLMYVEGASYDEFWYAMMPTDRYFLFKSDGIPFAIAQPFAQMYTGSLNPLLWRPIPGVRTLSFEPILVDVTGMLPLLVGTHNITLEVFNGLNYWYVFPMLLVYTEDGVMNHRLLSYQYTDPTRKESEVRLVGNATLYRLESSVALAAVSSYDVVRVVGGTVYTDTFVTASRMEMSLNVRHTYNDVWDNITLRQEWIYRGISLSLQFTDLYIWFRDMKSLTDINYGFLVYPEGDPAEATTENPVPANFSLVSTVDQTLIVNGYWPFTKTQRLTYTRAVADSVLNGTLNFIGPTAAIITGLTDRYGATTKTIASEEYALFETAATPGYVSGLKRFSYSRTVSAYNEWPSYWILGDVLKVLWL